jgi:ribosome biogenesis GTPase
MHRLTEYYADTADLEADELDTPPGGSRFEDLAGDDHRYMSMGRQSLATGKARPQKDKHGRPVNSKHRKTGAAKSPAAIVENGIDPASSGHAGVTGMVHKKTVGRYWVHTGGRVVECAISNMLRKQLVYPIADPTSMRRRVMEVKDIKQVDPVAIGDVVRFVDAGDDEGLITEVLPRRSKLVRRAAGNKPLEQVIVANVDQIMPIVSCANPTPNWEVLDRFLAAAEWLGVPAIICLTKLDLGATPELFAEVENYRRVGYRVLLTSTVNGEGIAQFKQTLAERVSVLVGPSGVGKTSLLNSIQPNLGLKVSAVSQSTNKGKHTTTHLEMFPLEIGGSLIDTPGMREFGLWDVKDAELANAFPEMRPLVGQCQFGMNCRHLREPGCAIRAAVNRGEVGERRYQSYLKLRG